MNSLRDQGALLPIEGLIETASARPSKKQITEKIYNANFTNGHLYGIPTAYYYGGTGGAIYREDLRQKWGARTPTSEGGWPSLESFLAAVVKNAPELIPFVNVATQSVTSYAGARRALTSGVTKTGVMIPDPMVDWQLIDEEEYAPMVESAELLRSWWEQGYINKTDRALLRPKPKFASRLYLSWPRRRLCGKRARIQADRPNQTNEIL